MGKTERTHLGRIPSLPSQSLTGTGLTRPGTDHGTTRIQINLYFDIVMPERAARVCVGGAATPYTVHA